MNHVVNARIRKLPECPECSAPKLSPCLTESGVLREPHRVRERIVAGEIVVLTVQDARAAKRIRALRELVAAINGKV